MRNIILLFFAFCLTQIKAQKLEEFYKSVVQNGLVKYDFIKSSQSNELTVHIKTINNQLIADGNVYDKKHLYLNLYNLLVIQQVVQNYPTKSPMNIVGFFDSNKFTVGNKQMTLNELENNLIRPTYKDPRVHFALVCGAKGCPPIQDFPFTKEKLNEQLSLVTQQALNNSTFIQSIDEKNAKISEIFDWYAADFGGNNKGIIDFINQYRTAKINSFSFYSYDWTLNDFTALASSTSTPSSNVQAYTPSVLLRNKQYEIQFFNNLYTQKAWRNAKGEIEQLGKRESWNTLMMTFNYGVSKNSRFNIGLDVNLRSTRVDASNSNAIDIFRFEQNDLNRTTIATLGPKIKWSPLKSVPKFSIQSSFWLPVAKNLESTPWLEYDRYSSWTQFFYDKTWNNKYQLFTEIDLWFRIPKLNSNIGLSETRLQTPVSAFFSYFPTNKSTVYAQVQYSPTVTNWPEYFLQTGLGGKYQVLTKLQLEASYTNFVLGNTAGAGATFNVGLRFIGN